MISTITPPAIRGGLAGAGLRQAANLAALVSLVLATLATAADADKPPPAFQPGDISVGDPISLPVPASAAKKQPAAAPPDTVAPAAAAEPAQGTTPAAAAAPAPPGPAADRTAPAAASPPALAAGNGWLGLTAEASQQPGRWVVADVAANGPAAKAGILPGDELRAINGTNLSNAEELAQSMTSIAVGQDVRIAVARNDQVVDVVVRAAPRPPVAAKPNWQQAAPTAGTVSPGPAAGPTEPPSPAAQTAAPQPPSTVPPSVPLPTEPTTSPPPFAAVPEASPPAAADAAAAQAAPAAGRWRTPGFVPPQAAAEPSRLAVDPAAVPPAAAAVETAGIATPQSSARGRTALGVRTLPIDSGMQARFRLPEPSGAYVLGVVQDLPASKAGVPPGSIIVALDNQPVRSPADLTKLVTGGPVGRPVSLEYVLPGGEERRADVVLQPLELPLQRALAGPEPTAVPTLQRAERPVAAAAAEPVADADAVRQEVRFLRQRLERLEQWLQQRSESRR
jgi:S1-C subfamily serine protease